MMGGGGFPFRETEPLMEPPPLTAPSSYLYFLAKAAVPKAKATLITINPTKVFLIIPVFSFTQELNKSTQLIEINANF
jgi:hypothetical protein